MKKGKENTPHIGIYGRRNNGKSTLINRIANQDLAIVSDVAGTTTDPVKKSFELTGFGPVVLIDTAGTDDQGELGQMRIDKTFQTIQHIDLALLVVTNNSFGEFEKALINEFQKYKTAFVIVHNKADIEALQPSFGLQIAKQYKKAVFDFDFRNNDAIHNLITTIQETIPEKSIKSRSLVGDLINYGDIILLITPIDIEAPAGRLILPQVQTIRDILDNDCVCIVLKEREVDGFLRKTGIQPKLAITDSQIFLKADASIPRNIPLTSFSIILARLKGDFESYLKGTPKIDQLQDNDRILLLESCSHHVSCDDIGRIKIPRWISSYTGKNLKYDVIAGLNKLDRPIEDYSLVIQCGGCVVTEKQLRNRLQGATEKQIPVTNYGMAIAYVQGIYQRAISPFVQQKISDLDYL